MISLLKPKIGMDQDTSTVTSGIETITPDEAAKMLARNDANRPCDKRRAARIAGDIMRGDWKVNGDAIRISKTGRLLDGQHRLNAVIIANTPVQTFVVRGLEDSVFGTIDTNQKSRTAADVLAIRGYRGYTHLAAMARAVHIFNVSGKPISGNTDHVPTVSQIEAIVQQSPGLQQAAIDVFRMRWCRQFMSTTLAGFCLYKFRKDDERLANEFFNCVETGANLSAGSPIILLRNRLISAKTNRQETISRLYMYALTFKAYKLFRDGAEVRNLWVRFDGDSPEKNIFDI